MGSWKEIFVFVIGTSPQIITETIYALSQKKPPVLPEEIYILTTRVGKEYIHKSLIERNILGQLCREYNLPVLHIKEENILVPKKEDGTEIEDICSEGDNELIADLITSFIREQCKRENVRLHCSLAGGRKTMSFYLGAALQMFGRPWDKLYHVIVSPDFESNPEFFYKPRVSKQIRIVTREGTEKIVSTGDARIMLAELPFIRLGRKMNLKGRTFSELVQESQREIDLLARHPELVIDRKERLLLVNDIPVYLRPMMMLIYLLFARIKQQECSCPERPYCLECNSCFRELNDILSYESLKNREEDIMRVLGRGEYVAKEFFEKWKSGLPADVGRQYISKINREIKSNISDAYQAGQVQISSLKIYAASRYGLKVDKTRITIN